MAIVRPNSYLIVCNMICDSSLFVLRIVFKKTEIEYITMKIKDLYYIIFDYRTITLRAPIIEMYIIW